MTDKLEPADSAPGPDPTLFFRPLAGDRPPEEFWTGFWPSVRAGIRDAQMRPAGLLTRGRALLLGSSAGLMAAAAILVVAFLVVPDARIPAGRGPSGRETLRAASAPTLPAAPSPPVLEDLKSASARIYTFHVGDTPDSTEVILIVDESLDI